MSPPVFPIAEHTAKLTIKKVNYFRKSRRWPPDHNCMIIVFTVTVITRSKILDCSVTFCGRYDTVLLEFNKQKLYYTSSCPAACLQQKRDHMGLKAEIMKKTNCMLKRTKKEPNYHEPRLKWLRLEMAKKELKMPLESLRITNEKIGIGHVFSWKLCQLSTVK